MVLSHRWKAIALLTASASLLALAVFSRPVPAAAQQGCSTNQEVYQSRVQPILRTSCYRCHSGMNHRGGFRLDTREALLHGGEDGVVVVPFHPEQSLLIKLIRHQGPVNDPMPMPPKGKLSNQDIAAITNWIACGAQMPQ